MYRFLKKYPLSLCVVLAIAYLSFFRPPSTGLDTVAGFDKLVHFCMYFGLSGLLWWEYRRAHRKHKAPGWHAWAVACACPLLFSGAVELLQACCTTYRSGDWMDFAANACGVAVASLAGWKFLS